MGSRKHDGCTGTRWTCDADGDLSGQHCSSAWREGWLHTIPTGAAALSPTLPPSPSARASSSERQVCVNPPLNAMQRRPSPSQQSHSGSSPFPPPRLCTREGEPPPFRGLPRKTSLAATQPLVRVRSGGRSRCSSALRSV